MAIDHLRKEGYSLNTGGSSYIKHDGDLFEVKDVILKAKKIANLEVSRKDISVNRRLRTDLSSYGFDIVDITGETNEDLSIGGTAPSLKQFLEKKYQMNLMVKSKSILSFPSGSRFITLAIHHTGQRKKEVLFAPYMRRTITTYRRKMTASLQ
jgi:hypothetical protein